MVTRKAVTAAKPKKAAKPIDEGNPRAVAGRKRYDPKQHAYLVAAVIAELESGKSLNKACAAVPGAPNPLTFMDWVLAQPEGARQYADARIKGYTMMAEEIQDIADTPMIGTKSVITRGPDGETVQITREEMLGHRRLQVDTRKWLLSKVLPKIFGDRTTITTENPEALAASLTAIAARLPV